MTRILLISVILAGFLLSSFKVLAQSKFALSATVAPFYNHLSSTVEIPDNNGGTNTSEYKSEDSWKGNWFGLNGRYSFSSKWSASTGLWLSESRVKAINYTTKSYNFSIPVMVNFQTSERRLSPYFSAGALFNFETTTHFNLADFISGTIKSGSRTSRISPTAGAGVIYNFSKHMSVIAQPTFSYIIPASGVDSHNYQLLLHVQLMYKF